MTEVVRTGADIADQIEAAFDATDAGQSIHPGKSYEDGVLAALGWVLGNVSEPPLPTAD